MLYKFNQQVQPGQRQQSPLPKSEQFEFWILIILKRYPLEHLTP